MQCTIIEGFNNNIERLESACSEVVKCVGDKLTELEWSQDKPDLLFSIKIVSVIKPNNPEIHSYLKSLESIEFPRQIDTIGIQDAKRLMETFIGMSDPNVHSILILDEDCWKIMLPPESQVILDQMFQRASEHNASIFVSCQQYTQLPNSILSKTTTLIHGYTMMPGSHRKQIQVDLI